MDCHRPSAFAMTKGARGGIHKLVIARVACNSNETNGSEFFLFSVFVLAIIGLWGLPPFVRGEVAKQQGG